MVSASKAARDAKKAASGKAPKKAAGSKKGSGAATPRLDEEGNPVLDEDGVPLMDESAVDERADTVKRLAEQMDKHGLSDRVTTGVLSSLKQSRDVKITSASLTFHGRVLMTDTILELTYGRRYGQYLFPCIAGS